MYVKLCKIKNMVLYTKIKPYVQNQYHEIFAKRILHTTCKS